MHDVNRLLKRMHHTQAYTIYQLCLGPLNLPVCMEQTAYLTSEWIESCLQIYAIVIMCFHTLLLSVRQGHFFMPL